MPTRPNVSELMTSPVTTVGESTTLVQADRLFLHNRLSCLPVVDRGGRPVGVVSRTDLLRVGRVEARAMWTGQPRLLDLADQVVKDVMTPRIITIDPDATISKLARTMTHAGVHRVFVESGGELLGVVSTRDLLKLCRELRIETPIREVMQTKMQSVLADTAVDQVVDKLNRSGEHAVAVVDDDAWPIGTFSQREALFARDVAPETPVEEVMSQSLVCLEASMPLYRAAGQAYALRARRVIVVENDEVVGLLGGLDIARKLAA